jgi:hypothetical protein
MSANSSASSSSISATCGGSLVSNCIMVSNMACRVLSRKSCSVTMKSASFLVTSLRIVGWPVSGSTPGWLMVSNSSPRRVPTMRSTLVSV